MECVVKLCQRPFVVTDALAHVMFPFETEHRRLLAVMQTNGPSRDHTEPCRTRIIQAMSSDAGLSARVREAHERMSRSVSAAEPHMQKVILAEHTIVPVSLVISTPHSVCTCCPWWIIIFISPTVEHVRPDDSDELTGSKKLKLSGLQLARR